MKPSNFTMQPWSSVFGKSESETIARNIMVILKRTGDQWRELPWDEYKEERLKDGGFVEWKERPEFDRVQPYTVSPETAALFSPDWKAAKEAA